MVAGWKCNSRIVEHLLKGELLWRVHLRPLNNIRSCCLPPGRKGKGYYSPMHSIYRRCHHASLTLHCAMLHSSVQCDTMQTWEKCMLHICIWGMPGYVGGKHENILSDKFSTIETRGLDMLSRPPCLIALFRKNQLETSPTFASFALRIILCPTQT